MNTIYPFGAKLKGFKPGLDPQLKTPSFHLLFKKGEGFSKSCDKKLKSIQSMRNFNFLGMNLQCISLR